MNDVLFTESDVKEMFETMCKSISEDVRTIIAEHLSLRSTQEQSNSNGDEEVVANDDLRNEVEALRKELELQKRLASRKSYMDEIGVSNDEQCMNFVLGLSDADFAVFQKIIEMVSGDAGNNASVATEPAVTTDEAKPPEETASQSGATVTEEAEETAASVIPVGELIEQSPSAKFAKIAELFKRINSRPMIVRE